MGIEKEEDTYNIQKVIYIVKCNNCCKKFKRFQRVDLAKKWSKKEVGNEFKYFYEGNILCNECWEKFRVKLNNVFEDNNLNLPDITRMTYQNGWFTKDKLVLYK